MFPQVDLCPCTLEPEPIQRRFPKGNHGRAVGEEIELDVMRSTFDACLLEGHPDCGDRLALRLVHVLCHATTDNIRKLDRANVGAVTTIGQPFEKI